MRAKSTLVTLTAALLLFVGAASARAAEWSISATWLNTATGERCPTPSEPTGSFCQPHDTLVQNGATRYVYPNPSSWPVALVEAGGEVWAANVGSLPSGMCSIDRYNPATGVLTSYAVLPWPTALQLGADGLIHYSTLWPSYGTINPANGEVVQVIGPVPTPPTAPPVARAARHHRRHHRHHHGRKKSPQRGRTLRAR